VPITIRRMGLKEVHRVREIDRSERIRSGYAYEDGQLKEIEVNWDSPRWAVDGEGDHSVSAQIAFCRDHLEKGGRMLGAFDGDNLVGIGILQFAIRDGVGQLAFLHVSKAYRRQGIGSRILQEFARQAKAAGNEQLYVSATPSGSAVGFYLSHGFAPVDEPIPELFELEPEDIHMIKTI
jgi:ribosomal protein S18 acetylase RimI-like enzyme